MIEEEVFRSLITVFIICIVVVIGSYLTYFYISRNKMIDFYNDVKKIAETMVYMKTSFGPPSYRELRIRVPSGCKLKIDNITDIIYFGCGNESQIVMKGFGIDILLIKEGIGCEVKNGTFKEGEYRIVLALVSNLPNNIKPCVVYFK